VTRAELVEAVIEAAKDVGRLEGTQMWHGGAWREIPDAQKKLGLLRVELKLQLRLR
jgi:hypothetical protein